ncbi:2OG-Fe(II) oxygenase [Roseateles sp. BYS96W]|uniref:2OG-Fe(II) oxygenase n=1 Tax=Pelomonas nitida TaxID=3299027 RepID=A0ABW7GCX8_9BURK
MTDFIEVYDGALSPDACRALVERFRASPHAQRGETGSGVDVSLKDSWDIAVSRHAEWADACALLNDAVIRGFKQYLRRYAHLALAPLKLQMQRPDGSLALLDADGVAGLGDEHLMGLIAKVFRPGAINLQRYVANQGGYPYWHCEQYPRLDQGEALHRAVLWTIYLNDDFTGGETEFLYQGRRITPRTGSLLIAPGGFTHTHRGNRPTGGDKFIATSWVMYQRAENLFGAG